MKATAARAALAVALLAGCTSTRAPLTSGTPSPSPLLDSASPAARFDPSPTAPNVVGVKVDAAMAAMQAAGCSATVVSIINGSARVGTVLTERTASNLCEVALSISAGPRTEEPRCSRLTVTVGPAGAGLGHAGFPLHFRNSEIVPCSLSGYPTILATDSISGKTIRASQTPSGYLGGTDLPTPALVLAPDDQVSALVEGTDNPVGNATSCSDLIHLRVIVNSRSTPVDQSLSNCSGIEVHRYLPGTTGRA